MSVGELFPLAGTYILGVCIYVKGSTGHTHPHTDREQYPRHRHTHAHDKSTTPTP